MKRSFPAVCIFALSGAAQAGALEVPGVPSAFPSGHDGTPMAFAAKDGPCGSFVAALAAAAYSGNETGYADGFFPRYDAPIRWSADGQGAIVSMRTGAGTADHISSLRDRASRLFMNGERNPVGFAILNSQISHYAAPGHFLVINDSPPGNDSHPLSGAHAIKATQTPESRPHVQALQTWAMLLAGLALLGLAALRRRIDPFD